MNGTIKGARKETGIAEAVVLANDLFQRLVDHPWLDPHLEELNEREYHESDVRRCALETAAALDRLMHAVLPIGHGGEEFFYALQRVAEIVAHLAEHAEQPIANRWDMNARQFASNLVGNLHSSTSALARKAGGADEG